MSYTLKTIFDRFEGDKAVFITPYGQEIFWPRNEIDEDLENGQIKYIALCEHDSETNTKVNPDVLQASHTKQFTKDDHQSIARKMLEELLNGE